MVKRGGKAGGDDVLDHVGILLERLDDPELVPDLHRDQFEELSGLLDHTLTTGGSNSVLLLGPRGVGKSHLISRVLSAARTSIESADAITVGLSGLVQTDDKLALKEIAFQMDLENVVSPDKVFGSFAQHLEFLLASLKSGDSKTTRPVVFVLEEFELFCLHHNQTLLYNLFDVAQTQAAPIIVIGVSSHFDVVESLEKRVKSRFNHRQLVLLPHPTFEDYFQTGKNIFIGRKNSAKSQHDHDDEWTAGLAKTLESAQARKLFKSIYATNNTVGFLKQFLATALSLLPPSPAHLTCEHLSEVFECQSEPAAEKGLMQGLSVLEVCVLVAIKHVLAVLPDSSGHASAFNFEMAYHEYDKFVSRKAPLFRYERAVVMKAWEALQELELITPLDKGTKIQKEFKHFNLQVTPDQIMGVVDAHSPIVVKEWATSVTFQE